MEKKIKNIYIICFKFDYFLTQENFKQIDNILMVGTFKIFFFKKKLELFLQWDIKSFSSFKLFFPSFKGSFNYFESSLLYLK